MHWRRISNEKCSSFVIDIHTNYERICQDNGIHCQLNSNVNSSNSSIWLPPSPSVGSVDQQDSHAEQRFPTEIFERGAASLFPGDVCGDTSSGISSMKSDWTGIRDQPESIRDGLLQSGSSDRSDTGFQDSFDDRTEDTDCESFATESTSYFNATPNPAALRIHNNLHQDTSSAKTWSAHNEIHSDEFRQCAKLDDLIRSANKLSLIDKRVSSRRWNDGVRGTSSTYHGTSSDRSFSGYESRAQGYTEPTRSVTCAKRDTPQPSDCEDSSVNTELQNASPLFFSSHHDLVQWEIPIRDEQSSSKPRRSVSLPNINVCSSNQLIQDRSKHVRSSNQLKQNGSNHFDKPTFDSMMRSREQYIWRGYVKRHGCQTRILPYRLKCKMNIPDPLDFQDDETTYGTYNQGEMRRKRNIDIGLKMQRQAVVHDPMLQTDASSTSSLFESSLVPTGNRLHMPNPSNKINHKLHSTLHCPCFLFFCFLCCYPAVFLMQKSDAHFVSGDDKLARNSAKRATYLYIIGAVCSVTFLSVMLFLVFHFLGI